MESLVVFFDIVLLLDRESNQVLKRAGNIRTMKAGPLFKVTASSEEKQQVMHWIYLLFPISLRISVFPH